MFGFMGAYSLVTFIATLIIGIICLVVLTFKILKGSIKALVNWVKHIRELT